MNAPTLAIIVGQICLLASPTAEAQQAATKDAPQPEIRPEIIDCISLTNKVRQGITLTDNEQTDYTHCLTKDLGEPHYLATMPPKEPDWTRPFLVIPEKQV